MRRSSLILSMVLATLFQTALPAWAHGSSGPDATNFVSKVGGLTEGEKQTPLTSAPEGVTWSILGNDALLQLDNRSSKEAVVEGYSGEPYLRIGPGGVWENRKSPATFLNKARFATVQVPKDVSVSAEPVWARVSKEPRYAWHDHRVHWMSSTLPPQVAADSRAATIKIYDWNVPFSLGERKLNVQGTLNWIRPMPIWPWLLGGLVATSLPLAWPLRQPAGARRKQGLLRVIAVVIGVVALVDVVHTIDDLRALPATLGQNIGAGIQSALFIGLGLAGAVAAWRRPSSGWVRVALGAASLSFGIGFTHLAVLASSQLVTTLPEWFSRSAISATVALLIPAAFVAWRTYVPAAEQTTPPRKQPADRKPPAKARQHSSGKGGNR